MLETHPCSAAARRAWLSSPVLALSSAGGGGLWAGSVVAQAKPTERESQRVNDDFIVRGFAPEQMAVKRNSCAEMPFSLGYAPRVSMNARCLLPINLLLAVSLTPRSGLTNTQTSSLTPAAISAGIEHACVLLEGGAALCWGRNDEGQLGDGTKSNQTRPQRVLGLEGARALSLGTTHSCALMADGTVRCFGANSSGQLGDGSFEPRDGPVSVSGLSRVTQVSAGHQFSCALNEDAKVFCWGYNGFGQLGDRSKINRNTPVEVRGLSKIVEIGAGGGHVCVRNGEGIVYCWGRNDWGQLGDGHMGKRALRTRPGPVAGLLDATSLAVGFGQACGGFADGTAVCWGGGDQGQLGNGRAENAKLPQEAKVLPAASQLALSGGHVCALSDGAVFCAGGNKRGQLGLGRAGAAVRRPKKTPSVVGAKQVAVGGEFTCVLTRSNSVHCFGDNRYGQLGDGTTEMRSKPGPVRFGARPEN